MKERWYGDDRDLVKWGVLLHLSDIYSVKRILQVAYFRTNEWCRLEIDGQEKSIPESVTSHFKNLNNIENLSSILQIKVLDSLFENRDEYKRKIAEAIRGPHPCIIFLDPDTGLQPSNSSPKLEHVLASELKYIWGEIPVGDLLVLYQHRTNRNRQDWIEPKRKQFEMALGLPCGGAKVANELPKNMSDVAFYYCRKETA